MAESDQGDTPDRQLVADAQAGDPAAFHALVLRYRPRLGRFLRREVGDLTRADDLAQDAVDEAYENLATLRNSGAFYPWLHRIAYNLLLADRRHRRPLVGLDLLRLSLRPAAALPALKRLLVREAAAGLSPALYRVLVLHDELGYTVPEIAAALTISVEATKARLKRARAGMRARYPEGGENDDDDHRHDDHGQGA
jgi:RNA polymerase sigma-70 factor (ECF subfamily)